MSGQQTKVKGVVDLVFLMDISGSMEPCLEALKKNVQTFVTALTDKDANGNQLVKEWRAAAMGFRDVVADKGKWFHANPFVASVEELRTQLTGLEPEGGGDEPESLLDALHKVAMMPDAERGQPPGPTQWRYRSDAMRAIVVFSDASFPRKLVEPAGATLEDVRTLLMEKRIVLTLFAPDLDFYKDLTLVPKSNWHKVSGGDTPQKSLELFSEDRAKFQDTLIKLGQTLSKTAGVPLL